MNDVEILSNRTFGGADKEVLDCFVEYQQALIDKNDVKLNELMDKDYVLTHMSGKKQTKEEFIGEVMDGTLNYFKSEIHDPNILFDDDENATLISDVTLGARVYGVESKWTINTVMDFKKINGRWIIGKWDT
ncbi:nuclear transport factor 2 family protein [Methanobrevibacter sp.]|uniref:nuclear transport factor 2 family protein n=1 Tax=Methanobrevibacter sp. TaxID=66852 RepID=UPI00388DC027